MSRPEFGPRSIKHEAAVRRPVRWHFVLRRIQQQLLRAAAAGRLLVQIKRPLRFEPNTRRRPSGDHTGYASGAPSNVNRLNTPPLVSSSQMPGCPSMVRFSATRRPSGDSWGLAGVAESGSPTRAQFPTRSVEPEELPLIARRTGAIGQRTSCGRREGCDVRRSGEGMSSATGNGYPASSSRTGSKLWTNKVPCRTNNRCPDATHRRRLRIEQAPHH